MFSLIITIISIALVAALALATLYFGGDAFNQGSAKAAAATIVNQASQINGANTLYYLDNQAYANGNATALTTALVDGDYLSSLPSPGDSATGSYVVAGANDSTITLGGVKQAVCDAVSEQAGQDLSAGAGAVPVNASEVNTQFGCFDSTADGNLDTFVFK